MSTESRRKRKKGKGNKTETFRPRKILPELSTSPCRRQQLAKEQQDCSINTNFEHGTAARISQLLKFEVSYLARYHK